MLCVGLTGGIGSGKTTVANMFAKLGAAVIDADVIAREVVASGTLGLTAIVTHFGQDILTGAGELDRKKLREMIFQDEQAKSWLERTLHPLILQVIHERIRTTSSPYCIIVIPLLAETAYLFDFLNRVCVVDAPETLRKQWAAERDQVSLAHIETIMATQTTRKQRLAIADDVITNNHDLKALNLQVKRLHQQYLEGVKT